MVAVNKHLYRSSGDWLFVVGVGLLYLLLLGLTALAALYSSQFLQFTGWD